MNAITKTEFNPSLAVINGIIKTTSLKIAEHFGKRHDHVIRDIKKIIESTKDIPTAPTFGECQRINELANNKPEPYYELDKDCFMLVVMGYTGIKAMIIKIGYINAFNKMAEQVFGNTEQPLIEPPTIPKAQEGVLFNKVKVISGGRGKIRAELWSRFQNHYNISSYKDLPADQYEDAVQYLDAKQKEYLGDVEMFYISSKEIEERVKTLVGELVEKPDNTLPINLKFPDGMKTMTMQFETSEFQHGRWLLSLSDGHLVIQTLTEYELSMTMDQWIRYVTRELDYIVIKKDDFHVGNFVMEHLPAHLLPILVEKAGRRLSAIRV